MSLKICLSTPNTLMYPQGGHLWVFINWALGLKSCGCDVTWLDVAPSSILSDDLLAKVDVLRAALRPFALDTNLVVDFLGCEDSTLWLREATLPSLESIGPFDLLVDLRYDLPERLFANFRRKILINIDPGQYELALEGGAYPHPKHDLLFSIGERTRQVVSNKKWLHTPPCVFLDEWPFTIGARDAPWTTVAHWWGTDYSDNKREGFRPYMTIPSKISVPFELALNLEHKEEQEVIESHGFKVHDAHKIVASAIDYRSFIQGSAGEFSCAKPSYVSLQTGWISDRTINYLATGRPCVVQDTGPSRFLRYQSGLRRFSDLDGAINEIETVMKSYDDEARAARSIAEEFFDAKKVCAALLTRSL